MKLSVGTVQFGMPYGVSNISGQVPVREVERIIARARDVGIRYLDTAINYGSAESVLGEIGVEDFHVTSKLPPLPTLEENLDCWVLEHIESLLSRLKLDNIDTLLLHRAEDWCKLNGGDNTHILTKFLKSGMVKHIGVSAYSPGQIENIARDTELGSVQLPFNNVDQRLLHSGCHNLLKDMGVQLHVRSLFLQGLLFMDPDRLPKYFKPWRQLFVTWHRWLEEQDISPVIGCLYALRRVPNIRSAVVGVTSLGELNEIIAAAEIVDEVETIFPFPSVESDDPLLVEPSNWITV